MPTNTIRATSTGAILAAALLSSAAAAQSTEVYRVELDALNDSGVSGQGTLQLRGAELTVIINARGLEPGIVHLGHIHGLFDGSEPADSSCPTPAADTDGDGFIELGEGAVTYGGIILELGNVDPNADGRVNYRQTFSLSETERDMLTPLNFREIVLHGLTVPPGPGNNTMGEVDGENGLLLVLPVACGEISRAGGPRSVQF